MELLHIGAGARKGGQDEDAQESSRPAAALQERLHLAEVHSVSVAVQEGLGRLPVTDHAADYCLPAAARLQTDIRRVQPPSGNGVCRAAGLPGIGDPAECSVIRNLSSLRLQLEDLAARNRRVSVKDISTHR